MHDWTFPAGEQSKSPDMLMALIHRAAELRLSRRDLVVALGGGVTGDLAGLAAALWCRGVACLQVPTSLLAMVDSSVGGKTAVNLPAGKNLMGVFSQPVAVVCDPDVLETLPEDEYANGWAEIVKYGMLDRGVAEMLEDLPEEDSSEYPDALTALIARCVEVKRDVVAADERVTGYGVPHGRAVGVGLAVLTRAMVRTGRAKPEVLSRLLRLLDRFGLSAECPWGPDALLEAARADKKSTGGSVTLVLPCGWGDCRLESTRFGDFRKLLEIGIPTDAPQSC